MIGQSMFFPSTSVDWSLTETSLNILGLIVICSKPARFLSQCDFVLHPRPYVIPELRVHDSIGQLLEVLEVDKSSQVHTGVLPHFWPQRDRPPCETAPADNTPVSWPQRDRAQCDTDVTLIGEPVRRESLQRNVRATSGYKVCDAFPDAWTEQ